MKLIFDGLNPFDKKTGISPVQHGTIATDEGKLIDLVQNAYMQQGGSSCWYEAAGEDRETGEDYKVRWAITNADTEDESEACDWDEFELIKL